MVLSATQAKDLARALQAAFPTSQALGRMVRYDLGADLAAINNLGKTLPDIIFDLLEWADAGGKIPTLLTAAQAANPDSPELMAVAAAWAAARGQPTFRPPAPPETFVPRPGPYTQLRTMVLAAGTGSPVALTTTLQGAGGFGKTTLAAALCADPAVQAAFPGGIWWVTLGEQPTVATLLGALVAAVGGARAVSGDLAALTTALAAAWSAQRVLLVLDDVWAARHVEPFLRAARSGTRLVTTRNVNAVATAHPIRIDEMETPEAAALLVTQLANPPSTRARLLLLARQLGEWPLLLRIGGAALQERGSLGYALDQALTLTRQSPLLAFAA